MTDAEIDAVHDRLFPAPAFTHDRANVRSFARELLDAQLQEIAQVFREESSSIRKTGQGCHDGRYDWMADGVDAALDAMLGIDSTTGYPPTCLVALRDGNQRLRARERETDAAIEAILTAGHMDQEDLAHLRAAYENNAPERRLDKIKQSALSIFNDPPSETPQVVRDVIEWYDATLRQP